MVKTVVGLLKSFFLNPSTYSVSKYKFKSSDVKPYLTPHCPLPIIRTPLSIFNNLHVCPFIITKIIAKITVENFTLQQITLREIC